MQKMHVAALVIILAGLGVVLNRTFRGEERPVETKAPVQAEETYLEKERKRTSELFRQAVEEDRKNHAAGANEKLSPWVRAQYEAFEARRPREGFARSVGYGAGTYYGHRLEFFAYTTKDFAVELSLSIPLYLADKERVENVKASDPLFEGTIQVEVPGEDLEGRYLPGARTWIRKLDPYAVEQPPCVMPDMSPCFMGGLMETLLRELSAQVPKLRLRPQGRFTWS